MAAESRSEAELAVLEAALTEHFGGALPPDLWPLPARAPAAAPRAVSRAWLAAALLLLGLGALAVLAVSRAVPDAAAVAPDDDLRAPAGPRTLAELQQRLAAAKQKNAELRARGSWCAPLARWIDWQRQPLADLFRFGLSPAVDRDDLAAVVAALATAQAGAPCDGEVWTHELLVICDREQVVPLLLQVGGPTPPRVGFRSPAGAVPLAAPTFPFDALDEPLRDVTQRTIGKLGLVLGPDGFAAVPDAAETLELVGVPGASAGALARFRGLRTLDLHRSPEWHDSAALQAVAATSVQQLTLAPGRLAADAWQALGGIGTLQGLWLLDGPPLRVMLADELAPPTVVLPGPGLRELARLSQLRELAIAGRCDDAVLAALAGLPLRRLALVGVTALRGDGLAALPQLEGLLLRGTGFDPALAGHLGGMPALSELTWISPQLSLGVATLSQLPALRRLHLEVARPSSPSPWSLLAACPALESLTLRTTPPLRDEDLGSLYALRQLRRLQLDSPLLSAAARAALAAALPQCRVGNDRW